jgi:predicted kinase
MIFLSKASWKQRNLGLFTNQRPTIKTQIYFFMKKCIILIGPPCSGKSTFVKQFNVYPNQYLVLSCDEIRKTKGIWESLVWITFYQKLEQCVFHGFDIIIDNTNCRKKYINEIIKRLSKDYTVEYKLFDIPLYRLYYRNINRYISTRKWIPFNVINSMKKNYNQIKNEFSRLQTG